MLNEWEQNDINTRFPIIIKYSDCVLCVCVCEWGKVFHLDYIQLTHRCVIGI